jgi:hypothetical protein
VALVGTDVSEELSACIIRVTRIGVSQKTAFYGTLISYLRDSKRVSYDYNCFNVTQIEEVFAVVAGSINSALSSAIYSGRGKEALL